MFIDKAKIHVRGGDGGNGAVSFRREKYVAAGGPDGGDGGKGGDVVFVVDDHLSTLLDFKYKRKYIADRGDNGGGKNCSGRGGENLIVKVPRGTLLKDAETGLVIKDMSDGEPFVAAKGGKGGFGNAKFATPTRQAPHFAKNGMKGESGDIFMELKLLADVGLLGFPNVGKSTLLSVVSAARPKIANYHFTTLTPQLGVIKIDVGVSYVMADIPGLIEGAAEGEGLGHEFLRHVERCRMLVHLVDVAGSEDRDPIEDFEKINYELEKFSPELAKRPQIVAANKSDLAEDDTAFNRLKEHVAKLGYPCYPISAATTEGVDTLMAEVWTMLQEQPPVTTYESETVIASARVGKTEKETIITVENGVYIVEGDWIYNLLGSVNFSDWESLQYLHRVLRTSGVYEMLEEKGIQEHDTVSIYGVQFDYVK